MLQSFLSWWIARLAELLPANLRADPDQPPDALVLRVQDHGRIDKFRRDRGAETALPEGAPAPRGLPQCLVLPEGYLLERKVELPLAIARDADRVVALDFDRLTPFSAEATIWGLIKTGEDPARAVAQFNLGLVPKTRLEPLLATLKRHGLHPTRLECIRPAGARRWLTIAGAGQRDWSALLTIGGLALLVIAAIASPLIRQEILLDRIETRIAAVSDRAQVAGTLLRRLSPGQDTDRLLMARVQIPRALQALAAVTAALPDDTNLVSLSLQDDRLEMEGSSQSAARLIGLLAAQPSIHDPNFSSPVTRTADGKDAFTLSATVNGGTPDPTAADNSGDTQ